MENTAISHGAYRLGQISSNPPACNAALLQRIADAAAPGIGTDFLVLAVFEHGIERQAALVSVAGPWPVEAAQRIADVTRWDIRERPLAHRLGSLDRNTVYRRSEIVDDRTFRASRLFAEVLLPMRLAGDQAVAVYRRADGCELMVSAQSLDERKLFSDDTIRRIQSAFAFVGECWAATWRAEPAWMKGLKPQSRRVLDDLLAGYDDDQIAQRTGLTYHSVRAHLKRLFRDAGVRSRLHLMQQLGSELRGSQLVAYPVAPAVPMITTTPKAVGVLGAANQARKIGLSVAG